MEYLLPTAYCLLLTAYCLLLTAYCLLLTAYCLLPTGYCLLLTAYCLLPTGYCILVTAYCSLHSGISIILDTFTFRINQQIQGMESHPELSIIILCYRSEEAIIEFADRTRKLADELTDSYEIVLVANYIENSGDRTGDIVKEIAAKNDSYRYVSKPKKGMMGWDMKEGLNMAMGEYLCVIDGDGQFPIESIGQCFREIKDSGYGLVKTFRSKRNDGIWRRLISGIYNFLFTILFPGIKTRDANSKPKIISRRAFELMDLQSDDWFIDAEIMINVRRHGIKFYEFPVEFEELKGRASFVKLAAVFEFVRNLIKYWINEFRNHKDRQ